MEDRKLVVKLAKGQGGLVLRLDGPEVGQKRKLEDTGGTAAGATPDTETLTSVAADNKKKSKKHKHKSKAKAQEEAQKDRFLLEIPPQVLEPVVKPTSATPVEASLAIKPSNKDLIAGFGLFGDKDFSGLELKPDHPSRPIFVCPDKHIFLETFSSIYPQAYDFLIAVSEPVCRPPLMHEYLLTPYSLYAAVSVGLKTEDIISVMERLSKTRVPESIKKFIRDCTTSYGKVKLVLQKNKYFVESPYADILERLLKDEAISKSRVKLHDDPGGGIIRTSAPVAPLKIAGGTGITGDEFLREGDDLVKKTLIEGAFLFLVNVPDQDSTEDDEGIETGDQQLHSFEINNSHVEHVKKRCIELDFPMLEEYDFRNDTVNPNLDIDLKPTTLIRPYQEKSLSKMFGNGRARSGIIVLPCGAGKTLVGITACCTIKKSTIVLCTSAVSVEQWRHQFKLWANIDDRQISRFTSDTKEKVVSIANITITTYTMIAFGGKRSKESLEIMKELQSREWGLLILDEVHVVPAEMFRKVIYVTAAHCKLGLTATLVREDERISDLNFLIGPKLYEANWMDLQRDGHIASVQCAEVWCPMTPAFCREYTTASPRKRKMLYVMNPNKFRACEFLIRYHEQRGDKIIVFSDNIFALQTYAKKFGKPYIYGPTSGTERMRVLDQFQHNPALKTIFISKVGDNSIDLPGANVIIQISSHFGSRRQEAQRLGRILRAKEKTESEYNAFFYSLVSKDTQEMYYSTKRQQFLIDQGYSFKVIPELPDMGDDLCFSPEKEQLDLLAAVLAESEEAGIDEVIEDDYDEQGIRQIANTPSARRSKGSMKSLSGGDGLRYLEFRKENRSKGVYARQGVRHALFKKRYSNTG